MRFNYENSHKTLMNRSFMCAFMKKMGVNDGELFCLHPLFLAYYNVLAVFILWNKSHSINEEKIFVWLLYVTWHAFKTKEKYIYGYAFTLYTQGRINVPRGPWHIISAGPLDPPPPPPPSNGILDTEFSIRLKKYPLVFHALKGFLCIYKQKELQYAHQ